MLLGETDNVSIMAQSRRRLMLLGEKNVLQEFSIVKMRLILAGSIMTTSRFRFCIARVQDSNQ